jgi:hypothetical protein
MCYKLFYFNGANIGANIFVFLHFRVKYLNALYYPDESFPRYKLT